MRGWRTALAAGCLCGLLAACGGGARPFDPEATAQALRQAPGVFSEELERLDPDVAARQYGLEDYLLREPEDPSDPAEEPVVAYCSTGATAEELAVVRFQSDQEAERFETAAWEHIADQKEANESYRPQEMPKLDRAVVERRGESVLILVSADPEAAQAVLDGLA